MPVTETSVGTADECCAAGCDSVEAMVVDSDLLSACASSSPFVLDPYFELSEDSLYCLEVRETDVTYFLSTGALECTDSRATRFSSEYAEIDPLQCCAVAYENFVPDVVQLDRFCDRQTRLDEGGTITFELGICQRGGNV